MKRSVAYYPLTFYFGVILLILAGILIWLSSAANFQFNWLEASKWFSSHQTLLLIIAIGILGLTLATSGVAYRQVCHLTERDYALWLQQRATRTLFPFFLPLHDWLRLRVTIYRWWHTRPYASAVHTVLLIVFIFWAVNGLVRQLPNHTLISGAPGLCSVSGGCTADHYTVTGITSPTTAGNSTSPVVTVYNSTNQVITSYTGTIHFTSTDAQAVLPADYTFVTGDVGTHTFTAALTLKTAATQSVTVTESGTAVTGSQTGIVVNPANATVLLFASLGTPTTTAGNTITNTLTVKDAYNNTVTTYGQTIHFTSTDAQAVLPADYTFIDGDSGAHSFNYVLKTAGSQTITATSTDKSAITGSLSPTITAANASSYQFLSAGGTATAGSAFNTTLTAYDAYSNVATNYVGTAHFTSTDTQAVLPADYTFVSGDHGQKSFSLTLKTAGSKSYTATDSVTSAITATSSITVNPATPAAMTISSSATSLTAGSTVTITAVLADAYGNTATNFTGAITFTSSDTQAVVPGDYSFTVADAGIHAFSVALRTAGTQKVTLSSTSLKNVSAGTTITVAPATASSFSLLTSTPSVRAGDNLTVTVVAKDAYGNVATGYNGAASFRSTDAQAALPSGQSFTDADAGQKQFSLTFKTAGSQTLTFTGSTPVLSSKSLSPSTTITVTNAAAATIELTGLGSHIKAGTPQSLTATVKDVYGNVATDYSGVLRFTATDKAATLPDSNSLTFANEGTKNLSLKLVTAGLRTVSVADSQNAQINGSSLSVTVDPAAIDHYVFGGTPSSVNVNDLWTATVTAVDAYSNVVDNDSTTIITPGSTLRTTFYTDTTKTAVASTYQLLRGVTTLYAATSLDGTLNISVADANNKVGSFTLTVLASNAAPTNSEAPSTPITSAPSNSTATIASVPVTQNTNTALAVAGAASTAAALPAVASAAASGMVNGVSYFNTLFLGYIPRRRRRNWGVVRDDRTGLPIAGVFVELLNARSGQQVKRLMTDKSGRYGFLVEQPGEYLVQIQNPLYAAFRSATIVITNPTDEILSEDIALHSDEKNSHQRLLRAAKLLTFFRWISYLHWPLLIVGTAVATYLYIQEATLGRWLVVLLYLVLWLAELTQRGTQRRFGTVVDKITRIPQALAVVQLTQTKNNGRRMVYSTITDSRGRFLFSVKPDRYTLIATKENYQPKILELGRETPNEVIELDSSANEITTPQ